MLGKSKLEVRIYILSILTQEPVELNRLIHKTDLSQSDLRPHLDFLIQHNFVEEQNLGKDAIFYAITGKGLRALNIVAPMNREAYENQAFQHAIH